MKCIFICFLLFLLSVFAEIDNEIEQNEIEVDETPGYYKIIPTKNPLYPQISNNKKVAAVLDRSNIDRYNLDNTNYGMKNRHRRSSDIESDADNITTTEAAQTSSETSVDTQPTDTENLIDSDINTTSTSITTVTEEVVVTTEENIVPTTIFNDSETVTIPSTTESDRENLIVNDTTTKIPSTINKTVIDNTLQKMDKLSDQIRAVLQHYQKVGVVALPGKQLFPDPLPMPDQQNNFGFGTVMTFTNMSVYGLNNFTVEHVNTDVDKLQVYLLLNMKRVVILGNYTLKSFFRKSEGPFNVTLVDVESEGAAELQPDENGQLQASESQMDMYTKSMKTDFKNLRSSLLQTVIDGAGIFLLDAMKPAILEKINTVLRADFNEKLKSVTSKLTGTISPVDIALAEGRRYCRNQGYDPYHIENIQTSKGLVKVKINDFLLLGMSRFYRVGNLSLSMDSGIIQIALHVATDQLNGSCDWSISVGAYEKKNRSNFTVEYLQVRAIVNQSMDLRQHPQLDDLDIGLGRINLKMRDNTPLDLIIAKVVNSLPKLIRHIIVDAVEKPLKDKAQEILNDINVNSIVEQKLPDLDKMGL